jgi:hypothetical protein
MPSAIVTKLLERVAVLEAQMKSLIRYQNWQMALLTAILTAVVTSWVTRR